MKRLFLFLIILMQLVSCTSIPNVDPDWVAGNCKSVGYFVPDKTQYSNCTLNTSNGVVNCKMEDGNYTGTLLDGEYHGYGERIWNNGAKFKGVFKNGYRWCGVQQDNTNRFLVYNNGEYSEDEAGVDWELVGGVVLVAAAVALTAEALDSGGSGEDYRSTCKYLVNGVEITRASSFGSCPSIIYEEPLMCSSYTSSPFTRYCDEKACGDSCISVWKTCHVGKGTACNNNYRTYP